MQIAWAQAVEKTRAVADSAAAEALLSAIKPDAQLRRPHLVRWSPDHGHSADGHCAWIVSFSGMPDSPDQPRKPDAIEVFVAGGTGAPRSTRIEIRSYPHDPRWGPVWTTDGGVLVAYDVRGKETVADVCVDVVRNGEARPFLREADGEVRSLASSPAGTVAIAFRRSRNDTNRVIVCKADGGRRSAIDLKEVCEAAAPSPDGEQIALVLSDQLAVVAAAGGAPKKLASLPYAFNGATAGCDVPQWCASGKSFVVAAGDDVVLADVDKGEVRRWTAKALGGIAVDVVLLPGDAIAAAVVLRQTDANLADLVMHAGEASRSHYLSLVWLDLQSGAATPSSIRNKWVAGGGWNWVDMPRVSDLVAEYAR